MKELLALVLAIGTIVGVGVAGEMINGDWDDDGASGITVVIGD